MFYGLESDAKQCTLVNVPADGELSAIKSLRDSSDARAEFSY
jgi:hypothetical protein